MTGFVWWIGLAHIVAYALLGATGALTLVLNQVYRQGDNARLFVTWLIRRQRKPHA